MILADKIILLRKKNGMNQEELADKLEVSRQSVSKWESAQSIPDLDRILQMSKIFGVSTDLLLKDELEITEETQVTDEEIGEKVSLEQASDFISKKIKSASKIALGAMLCAFSLIPLFLLICLSEYSMISISEDIATAIGLPSSIIIVAVAVFLFITSGQSTKEYSFIEKKKIDTEYGVSGFVKQKKKDYQPTCNTLITIGVIVCVLSIIPLFVSVAFDDDLYVGLALCVLFLLAGIGTFFLVKACTIKGAFDRLLQEGDYTVEKKANSHIVGTFSTVYWLCIVIAFIISIVIDSKRDYSWLLFAIGGLVYAATICILNAVLKNKNKQNK